jgi:hypothetical protein
LIFKAADFLQEELQAFYATLRRGGDEVALRAAIERLQTAINQVDPLANDPGEGWKDLTNDQRWGYVRVMSHLGTATHELKRLGTYVV